MNKLKLLLVAIVATCALFACNSQKRLTKKKNTYMSAAYDTLKKAVPEAEITFLRDTIKVLFPEHLLFQKSSSELNPENFPLMERFAKALNHYAKTKILINGYTDNTGGNELNLKISNDRATSAEGVLQQYAVSKDRTYKWGHGIENPIASNDTEEGRRKNRRVEFIILYDYLPEKN